MKTLSMRVDDATYKTIKLAANGQKRNISNFVEFATLQYLLSSQYVGDDEMKQILDDTNLVGQLELGKKQMQNEDYNIV
jgi:hypothetical protein